MAVSAVQMISRIISYAQDEWLIPFMIRINPAPVLTLWAAVVAKRNGFYRDEALTLGRAVEGRSSDGHLIKLHKKLSPGNCRALY